jgi:single-stranded-DNA-specific exonuclease
MDDPARRKIWHLLPHDPGAIERLSRALRVSPIVAQLLLNRRLAEPEHAQRFLSCPLTGLHEP